MMELDKDTLLEPIKEALLLNKLEYEDVKDKICAIIYTDGGALLKPIKSAGCGAHGYFYLDEPVKSNSSSPKGYPTKHGYTLDKIVEPAYKVNVLTYFDYRRGLGENTNNFAELSAGLFALRLVKELDIQKFTILSDSEYFVKNANTHLTRWVRDSFMSNGKELANKELWASIHTVWEQVRTKGTLSWVKAHNGDIGNTHADTNASMAINMDLHPLYDGTEDFIHQLPKPFWGRTHSMSPLFTEKRLILHSEGNEGNIYFQCSMGDQWPSNEPDRRAFIGKRIADTCVSVVILPEPEPVVELLSDFCRDVSLMDGLVCGRLDLLTQGTLYHHINQTKSLTLRHCGKIIETANKVELMSELKPARLSWRLANQFEWIADHLVQFMAYHKNNEEALHFKVVNITNNLFQIKDTKKDTIYELKEGVVHNEVIDCPVTMNGQPTTLTLTMNVDVPSRMDLSRMGKFCPDVYLIYWSDHDKDDLVYYATIFKIGEEYGLWASAYSNFHILTNDYKDNQNETNQLAVNHAD